MNKLTKKKLAITLLEGAVTAIHYNALCTIRWDAQYCDQEAEFDRYDDDILVQHLTEEGQELMRLADSLVSRIEDLNF